MNDDRHARTRNANDGQEFKHHAHYGRLGLMIALSFVVMYAFMYAMVNSIDNVYNNVNQFYMAGLMAAPMAIIEIAIMRSMYRDNRLNLLIVGISCALTLLFFVMIRQQVAVTNVQFLRSMIPHHAGAILMCEQPAAPAPQIKQLCQSIVSSQEAEIRQMKVLLQEMTK